MASPNVGGATPASAEPAVGANTKGKGYTPSVADILATVQALSDDPKAAQSLTSTARQLGFDESNPNVANAVDAAVSELLGPDGGMPTAFNDILTKKLLTEFGMQHLLEKKPTDPKKKLKSYEFPIRIDGDRLHVDIPPDVLASFKTKKPKHGSDSSDDDELEAAAAKQAPEIQVPRSRKQNRNRASRRRRKHAQAARKAGVAAAEVNEVPEEQDDAGSAPAMTKEEYAANPEAAAIALASTSIALQASEFVKPIDGPEIVVDGNVQHMREYRAVATSAFGDDEFKEALRQQRNRKLASVQQEIDLAQLSLSTAESVVTGD